jgi:hypothetical protein
LKVSCLTYSQSICSDNKEGHFIDNLVSDFFLSPMVKIYKGAHMRKHRVLSACTVRFLMTLRHSCICIEGLDEQHSHRQPSLLHLAPCLQSPQKTSVYEGKIPKVSGPKLDTFGSIPTSPRILNRLLV